MFARFLGLVGLDIQARELEVSGQEILALSNPHKFYIFLEQTEPGA